ncbi:hypothetical protein DRH27_02230 [Candidatus Falkowbacteria bacterium]|nr:MAG: hypothetical protein DRH27_02230 [Candidatus Falkowbacteria bacterium]
MANQNEITQKIDFESAKNWEYLKTQLDAYKILLEQTSKTTRALNGGANLKHNLIEHAAALSMCYNSVCGLFDQWLLTEQENPKLFFNNVSINPVDYEILIISDDTEKNARFLVKIQKLTTILNYWLQTFGPFATHSKKMNPNDAWK